MAKQRIICIGISMYPSPRSAPFRRCEATAVPGDSYCLKHYTQAGQQALLRKLLVPDWEEITATSTAPPASKFNHAPKKRNRSGGSNGPKMAPMLHAAPLPPPKKAAPPARPTIEVVRATMAAAEEASMWGADLPTYQRRRRA